MDKKKQPSRQRSARRPNAFQEGSFDPGSPTWCATHILRDDSATNDGQVAGEFFRAGDAVISHAGCGRQLGHGEHLFRPVAYLLRHAIELALKHTIEMACRAAHIERTERVEEVLRAHSLHPLWKVARRAIDARWPGADPREPNAVGAVIQDLHSIDKTGPKLRYSRDTRRQHTSQSFPDTVDLHHLRDRVKEVLGFLSGCAGEFDSNAESQRECE
jgi:hypothetical protein